MKNIFFTLLTVFVACIVCILLLEGALWFFHPLPVSPPEVSTVARSNVAGLKPLIIYERNMFGLRSVSLANAKTYHKGDRVIRIFCIGASTTDQPTQNTEDLWSALLESQLQKTLNGTGLKIEVAAYGRGGDTVADTCAWIKSNLLPFEPDIVILLLGINDLCWNAINPTIGSGNKSDELEKEKVSTPGTKALRNLLRSLSQIYIHAVPRRDNMRMWYAIKRGRAIPWAAEYLPLVREDYRRYPFFEDVDRQPDPIVEFEKKIGELFDYLKNQKIATIVLAQPVLWQPDMPQDCAEVLWFPVVTSRGYVRASTGWLSREMDRFNEVQKEYAEKNGFVFIPLDKLIPKTTDMFFDDCHFTDKGNQAVADGVYPFLHAEVKKSIMRRKFE